MLLNHVENKIDKLCWRLVNKFPTRVRIIKVEDEKYLLRFYIKHSSKHLPGIYLHHFYRGDQDRDLHNHPWDRSVSIILTGGYFEERLPKKEKGKPWYRTKLRKLHPGSFNIIKGDDFHRIDLLGKPTWTLFTSGKKIKNWGFMLRETGKFLDHESYDKIKNKKKNGKSQKARIF